MFYGIKIIFLYPIDWPSLMGKRCTVSLSGYTENSISFHTCCEKHPGGKGDKNSSVN